MRIPRIGSVRVQKKATNAGANGNSLVFRLRNQARTIHEPPPELYGREGELRVQINVQIHVASPARERNSINHVGVENRWMNLTESGDSTFQRVKGEAIEVTPVAKSIKVLLQEKAVRGILEGD
ncbi:hypothetical protein GE061_012433 [Apolygus lucorum]|uniref:Uncharacterized protein n=1 Tax=Apolygus lucorum TaxID=248454 RepID=A0A8S9XV03_APOLU|nr:hypothetical protein GE061_012433 [Apolygus lucorum]